MAYEPFADECTIKQMSEMWQIEYPTMCRIIRNVGMRPARRHYATQFFNREQQAQLARHVSAYMLYPRYLEMPDEPDHPEAREFNLSRHMELVETAKIAQARVKRLMEMVEQDQDEITALRTERAELLRQLDARHIPDDDDGLVLRLLHVASLDETGYAALAHAALDTNADAALLVDGVMKVLGVVLDAGIRKADNRLLTKAQTMTVYKALSTLAELGRMADTRLTQYAGVADALIARHQAPDTRTPEKAEVHP